jgi:hypothetical protein
MSVLHTTVFDQLPGRLKNQLLPYHTHLRMADGSPVVPLGIVKVPLQIRKFVDYISVRDGFCHCCKRIFINGLRLISNIDHSQTNFL